MAHTLWILCAVMNVAIAILHIIVIYYGEPAYRYFGAGEWMATQAGAGSMIPALITGVITLAFFVFAGFNLSGAGYVLLPLTFYALLAITAAYLLRGGVIVAIPFMEQQVSRFDLVSSYIAFAIGLVHAAALYLTYFVKSTT